MNKVILSGRLGKDPDLKHLPTGTSVCNFSLATSEKFKNKKTDQWEEKTEWHNIVVWGRLAEYAAQYLHKGSSVLVEGKISSRSWEDDKGNKRYAFEIVCSQIENMGSSDTKKNNSSNSNNNNNNNTQQEYKPEVNKNFSSDDIPF